MILIRSYYRKETFNKISFSSFLKKIKRYEIFDYKLKKIYQKKF